MSLHSPPQTQSPFDKQQRQVERVLDQLDRVRSRTDSFYVRSRAFERKKYRTLVKVFCPGPDGERPSEDMVGVFNAWTYDLSQGGIGLVALQAIKVDYIFVGFKIGETMRWTRARCVRCRNVPQTAFLEYGLEFDQGSDSTLGSDSQSDAESADQTSE